MSAAPAACHQRVFTRRSRNWIEGGPPWTPISPDLIRDLSEIIGLWFAGDLD